MAAAWSVSISFVIWGTCWEQQGAVYRRLGLEFEGPWGQFKEFASLLTRRGVPLKQKGRVYKTCVQSVMVYASETWALRVEEEQRVERNENVMLRWMCGVTLRDKVHTAELRRRLGIEGGIEVETG